MTTSGATTNARGEVAYPAPGAFPTDPLTPRETSHDAPILDGVNPDSKYRGSNKLRKRDDPRGWDGRESQQFTQASSRGGHKQVDSGVHMPEMDTQPGYTGNSSKPGVMTGAYSRLPNHEHGRGHGSTTTATDGVPIYANSPVSPTTTSATGTNTRDYGHTGPQHPHTTSGHNHGTAAGLAGATTLAGGASAASHAATPRDHHPTSTSSAHPAPSAQGAGAALPPHREDKLLEQKEAAEAAAERERNLVRNGRDPSSVARKDPYWGDVPFGTGVYNGVSGHGSAETPHTGTVDSAASAQHYPHEGQVPREGLQQQHAGGDGVAHQVTSKPGHVNIAGQQQQQQRAFPLTDPQGISAGGADQTGAEKLVPGQAHQNRDTRFSEGLAGAGAAAGAGYVASGLGDKKQQTRRTDEHDGSGRKDAEDPSSHGPVGSGLHHRDHNNKEVRQHKEKDAKDASPYHGSKAQDVDSKGDKHHSKEAAAAAAAAAAAGTGAAASYATRDKKSREPDSDDEGSEKKESKLHALFHRKSKDEQPAKEAGSASGRNPSTTTTTKPQHYHAYDDKNAVAGSRQTQAAKRDPFVAAGYPEHTHDQHSSTSPTSIYPTSDKLSKQAIDGDRARGPEHDAQHGDHSKLGLGAAGVAAGAGAGYLAHRQHEQPSSSMTSSSSPSTRHPTNLDNVAVSPKATTTAGATLPPTAAVNTTTPHGAQATRTAQPQPQPQPHYKTLASGTPSGIAVDAPQNHHHHHHHQDHASSAVLPTNRNSTGSSTTDSSGNSKGYRYAGAAGAGAGALGAGGAALLGKGRRSAGEEEDKEQKVVLTHRCRRCGEENDISGYFRGE
ncbi:hypothetical protein F4809DRAFT_212663 [Biscogniauxia mediterranea]|nr:hypothetical protein F4809DRAFT_212663 [Biscogniauxia mediterranea]